MAAIIIELVNGTWLWCTNICIIWLLNDRLLAPFGGLISSDVANGEATKGNTKLRITATITGL